MSQGKKAILIVALVLIADQVFKIWVKTNMYLGESHHILGSWFQIAFIENPGMAFGWELGGGGIGKFMLTLFRIGFVCFISWYLSRLIKTSTLKTGALVGVSLLIAGAAGNIIDSLFYGVIFSDSYGTVATMFPEGGGYGSFFHGKVVDMLYFPLIKGHYPSWVPFLGGEDFIFFRPIFNIADAAISIAIIYLLIFQRKFLATIFK